MEQPNTTDATPPRSNVAGIRNAFVYTAMFLVVAAFGFAAYLQLDTGVIYAAMLAATTFAVLIAGHTLVRRGQMVADLEAEIEELKAELETVSRAGPAALRREIGRLGTPPSPQAPQRKPLADPPARTVEETAAPGAKAASGSRAPLRSPAALPPVPATNIERTLPAAAVPPAIDSSTPERPRMAARATSVPAPSAPMPPPLPMAQARAVPAPIMPERVVVHPDKLSAPSLAPPPALGSEARPAAAPATVPPAGKAAAPNTALPTGAEIKDAEMARYWSVRPGHRPDPAFATTAPTLAAPQVMEPDRSARLGEPSRQRPSLPPVSPQPQMPAPQIASERPSVTVSAAASPAHHQVTASPVVEAPFTPPPVEVDPKGLLKAEAAPIPRTVPAMPSEERVRSPETSAPAPVRPTADGVSNRGSGDAVTPPMGVESEAMKNLIQQLASQLAKPSERPAEQQAGAAGDAPSTDAALDASVAALKQAASELQRQAPQSPPGSMPVASVKPDVSSEPTNTSSAGEGPSPYARLAVIAEAVAADRIDLLLDPILGLEDRKARHFEVSVRLRSPDGEMLTPDDYRSMLAGTGLLGRIDAAKLTRSAAIADRLTSRGNAAALFANVQGESLSDNAFLDVFADTFIDRQPVSSRLVLAFSQADVRSFGDVHWEAVTTMSELGFRFALEHITDLDMDFEMLKDNGFAFVKLDATVFLHGMRSGDNLVPSADICRHMAGLGFGLIVGGIVDEAELARIMGFGVVFGQGALFGRPHAVKVETRQRAAA